MNTLKANLKSIETWQKDWLNRFLIFSIFNIILIEFILNRWEDVFTGGEAIGRLLRDISLSFITSYIFYYIVVIRKNHKDKENIYEYVNKKTMWLINGAHFTLGIITQKKGITYKRLGEFPTKDELDKYYFGSQTDANPETPPNITIGYNPNMTDTDWVLLLKSGIDESQETISQIMDRMPYLDSDYVKILTNLEDCHFITGINKLVRHNITQVKLLSFSKDFYDFTVLLCEIREYAKQHFSPYLKTTSSLQGAGQ